MEREYITITIPKGGRPPKELTENEAATLCFERLTMTVREMADFHGVSMATMNRWLKKARCIVNGNNETTENRS